MDYSKFTFPPYEYRPYPKWVTAADGSRVVVQNADEAAAVCAAPKTSRKTLSLKDKANG